MDLNENLNMIIKDITEVSDYMWKRGWAEGNAGNISVNLCNIISEDMLNIHNNEIFPLNSRFQELSDFYFLFTLAGSRMRNIANRPYKHLAIIHILESGKEYQYVFTRREDKNIKLTSEIYSHLKIHQYLRKNNSPLTTVLHTHPTELIAFTQIEHLFKDKNVFEILSSMMPEVKISLKDGIGYVPYKEPGSEKLAEEIINSLEKHKVILLAKHGAMSLGSDIFQCFDQLDITNKAASIYFLLRCCS